MWVSLLNVGVADNLLFPVVLDEDLPVLFDLLHPVQSCNVAVTRAQAKKVDADSPALRALPFYGVELETTPPGKCQKSRNQRRRENFSYTALQPSTGTTPEMLIGFKIPDNIIKLQQEDPTLSVFLQRAKERKPEMERDVKTEEYFLQSGVLYRRYGQVKQLVVLQALNNSLEKAQVGKLRGEQTVENSE